MRDLGDREAQNIFKLKIDKILSEALIKSVKILNLFSSRFSSFFNFALLDFFNRILAKSLGS
jgi:nucleoside recognition membrane protein YjiH